MLSYGVVPSKEGMQDCYLPRMLGADMLSSLVLFALCGLRQHLAPPPDLILSLFFSMYRTYHSGKCFLYFTRSFNVAMSNHCLDYFVLKEMYVCFPVHARLRYRQKKKFQQLMLCLNMPKINHFGSGSWSLNQHWLLTHVEPVCLPASLGSSFAGLWRNAKVKFTFSKAQLSSNSVKILTWFDTTNQHRFSAGLGLLFKVMPSLSWIGI